MRHSSSSLLLCLALVACADEGQRPIGATCGASSECESGLCVSGTCLDPSADDDFDGLTNGIEAALGSNALNADSDYDGVNDGDEVANAANVDSDGDGLADILESLTRDSDGDCIVDQLDAADATLDVMRSLACSTVGVCGSGNAAVVVSCNGGVIACDYAAVPNWEAAELTCDGRDNDCDGRVDEGSADSDGDGIADCVDDDRDNDSVVSASDNCPEIANPGQGDADGDGIGDACDPPGAININGFDPSSPAASATPNVIGSSEPLLTLSFFSDDACTTAIGQGQADAAGRFAVALAVASDGPTDLFVRAANRAGLATDCRQTFARYVHDASAPPPVGLASPVDSPTSETTSVLELAAPIEPLRVELYRRTSVVNALGIVGDCTGSPWQVLALEPGKSALVTLMLAPNRSNMISARTSDRAGNASGCELLVTIIHDDEVPPTPQLSAATLAQLNAPQGGEPTFAVSGCAEADATIRLYSNDSCAAPVATLDTESDVPGCDAPGIGGWTAALEVGANTASKFWMQIVDQAGNASACVPLGNFVHDGLAPEAPIVSGIRGTSWGVGVATFAIEGGGEAGAVVALWGSADCVADALGEGVVGANGRWHADVTAYATTPLLYGEQIDRAGNRGACAALGAMFGPATFTLTSRGKPRSEAPIVISAPDGTLLAEVTTDALGMATATIVAGCSATTVTRYTSWGEHGWTSVLGLEPDQAVTLEVDDGNTDIGSTTGYYLPIRVPTAPAGTRRYRVATACGMDAVTFEGTPPERFEAWFDPACSAEPDLTLIVEALDVAGVQLGFVLAMHVPYSNGDGVNPVDLAGPWRTDFAAFTLAIDPGKSATPFELSHRFGHKTEVFVDFWNDAMAGFAAPNRSVNVTRKFPNIEHGHVGWRIATDHLGDGGTGTRSYTELGVYIPGSEQIALEDALLPRVWSAEVTRDDNDAWRVAWAPEPGLAAASDAFAIDLYASGASSVSWRLIGRPSEDTSLGLPIITSLPGSDAFSTDTYLYLQALEWFDWATVDGFGTWVEACTGVDLATCVRGLAETVTRTSGMQVGGESR